VSREHREWRAEIKEQGDVRERERSSVDKAHHDNRNAVSRHEDISRLDVAVSDRGLVAVHRSDAVTHASEYPQTHVLW
jgi:hypothetical protein